MLGWVLSLVVTASVGAPESTVVILTKRGAVPSERAVEAARAVEVALFEADVSFTFPASELSQRVAGLGVGTTAYCEGKKKCVLELGRQLGVPSLVAVSVAQVGTDLSVHAELLAMDGDGGKLAEETTVLPVASLAELGARFGLFAKRVKGALAVSPPAQARPLAPAATPARNAPSADAPVAKAGAPLTPAPTDAPALAVVAPAGSRTPAMVTGAAGVVLLAAAVGLVLSAGADQERLALRVANPAGVPTSPLMGSQALATASGANAKLTAAVGAGVAGAVLGGATFLLWPRAPEASTAR